MIGSKPLKTGASKSADPWSSRWHRRKIIRWAIAAFVVPLAIVATYFGARLIVSARVNSWRAQGMAAAQAGNHEKASEMLVRYLQRRPRDLEALIAYVRSRELAELTDNQHFAETIGALQLLLTLDANRLPDHRHLLELYVKLERRPEALDTAKAILAHFPQDVRTLQLKTEVLGKMREFQEALKTADQWSRYAPESLEAHMARLSMRARLNQSASSIVADASNLRTTHPDDVKFELLQGFAYALTGDDGLAAQWYKTASAHPGVSDEIAQLIVTQFDSIGLPEESLALLRKQATGGKNAD